MTPPAFRAPSIGLFDSGIGGLSILRTLHRSLPNVPLRYIADSAHAPYGDLDAAVITERCGRLAAHLIDNGARLVVVACNTATAVAIDTLRARWPAVPFVGVEPAVKPAVAATRSGRIGVMATSRTLASARMAALLSQHAGDAEVVLQPCPGLAEAIERAGEDVEGLTSQLARHCAPLSAAGVDTVVLGCTHYPFVREQMASLLGPNVRLIDSADAVARRAASLWQRATCAHAELHLAATSDPERLQAFAKYHLALAACVERLDC